MCSFLLADDRDVATLPGKASLSQRLSAGWIGLEILLPAVQTRGRNVVTCGPQIRSQETANLSMVLSGLLFGTAQPMALRLSQRKDRSGDGIATLTREKDLMSRCGYRRLLSFPVS